jgi:uncharacterized protein (TIGR00106 family)
MSDDKQKSIKVVADLVVVPVGVGTSLSKFVRESVKELDQFPGIRVLHTPMSSIIEADNLDQIFAVTKRVHEKMFEVGVQRVSTLLRIDDRRDKPRYMEDKTKAIM